MKTSILVLAALLIIAVLVYVMQTRSVYNPAMRESTAGQQREMPDSAVNFGYKCMWIAVKTGQKEKIAELLGIKNTSPCNWKHGIDWAYNNKIFISPQVGEWTLVVGWGLTHTGFNSELEEIASFKEKIDKLSKVFGEAQFFVSQRIAEYHLWARSVNGQTTRLYCYMGEKGENMAIEGEPTDFEKKYKLINTFSEQAKDEHYFERADIEVPDETFVMKLAGNWSIDPTTLEQRKDIAPGLGLLGK